MFDSLKLRKGGTEEERARLIEARSVEDDGLEDKYKLVYWVNVSISREDIQIN